MPYQHQVHVQHPHVAVAPGEEHRVGAAPAEEPPGHRPEALGPPEGVHAQGEHFPDPMVELFVDSGPDVGGKGRNLPLPAVQAAGADLDNLV